MLTFNQSIAISSLMLSTSYLASMSLILLNQSHGNKYLALLNGFILGSSVGANIMITSYAINLIK